MGWFRWHCWYIYAWSLFQCRNQSYWLPSSSLSWWSNLCCQPVAIVTSFTPSPVVSDIQLSLWIWQQLPVCLMLCYNITVFWQETSTSYWHCRIRNWSWGFCCGTNLSILVGCLWLEKHIPYNCWLFLSGVYFVLDVCSSYEKEGRQQYWCGW